MMWWPKPHSRWWVELRPPVEGRVDLDVDVYVDGGWLSRQQWLVGRLPKGEAWREGPIVFIVGSGSDMDLNLNY